MSRNHRERQFHENNELEDMKRDSDESALMMALISFLISQEQFSSHNFNNVHNKESSNKQHKKIYKTKIACVIPDIALLKEKNPNEEIINKHEKDTYNTDIVSVTSEISLKENKHHKNNCKANIESVTPEIIPLKEDKPHENTCKKDIVSVTPESIQISESKNDIVSVTSETIPISENISKSPLVINKSAIIKVPIVLAELQIIIPILNTFRLEDSTSEIKRIKKNVYLDECKLLPNSEMLFVNGFIKKSMEYITTQCIDKSELSRKIKNSTVIIPFKCTTKIKFITKPISVSNICEQEAELLNFYGNESDSSVKNVVGHSRSEQSFKFNETTNDRILCELVNSEIVETEIIENVVEEHCEISKEPICCTLTEKSVLYLTIKISQNQQVVVL